MVQTTYINYPELLRQLSKNATCGNFAKEVRSARPDGYPKLIQDKANCYHDFNKLYPSEHDKECPS